MQEDDETAQLANQNGDALQQVLTFLHYVPSGRRRTGKPP